MVVGGKNTQWETCSQLQRAFLEQREVSALGPLRFPFRQLWFVLTSTITMTDPTFSMSSLLDSLHGIERDFLHDEAAQQSSLVERLTAVQQKTMTSRITSISDQKTVDQLHQVVHRIKVMAEVRLGLEKAGTSLRDKMLQEAAALLEIRHGPSPAGESQDFPGSLQSQYMRNHFLATLDDPYPTQEDKDYIVRTTNEAITLSDTPPHRRKYIEVHQLTLWFINARRRSGWSSILRKFARNDRARMQLLCQIKMQDTNLPFRSPTHPEALHHTLDDVLQNNLGRPVTALDKKEFEAEWSTMISWIRFGVKEQVRGWMHELEAANKKSSPKPTQHRRAVSTAANRAPARKQTKAKAKTQPKKRASKTPSVSTDGEPDQLESTPELSMCSTADTSFSSLNGMMGQYDPFGQTRDAVLESPSLQAKGAMRKVKALPKRAQKPITGKPSSPLHGLGSITDSSCFSLTDEASSPSTGSFSSSREHGDPLYHSEGGNTLVDAQTSFLRTQPQFPPFDALPIPPQIVRRAESFSSNSLSAAFG